MRRRERICHVVSDGRRGIENQALGLAEALARHIPLDIQTRHIKRPGLLGGLFGVAPDEPGSIPDIWMGCGRAALSIARQDRKRFPDARFVYVQDPKRSHDLFDLIVAPSHDGLSGHNVTPILGSPNRIEPERLRANRIAFASVIDALKPPRIAILIGGNSKRHRFDRETAAALLTALSQLLESGASLMITASRRTPDNIRAALSALSEDNDDVWFWDGAGDNPYFAILGAADAALVTADSTNMLTEAATANLPVFMLPVSGRNGKFEYLYKALVTNHYARWWDGDATLWAAPRLSETDRAADAILALLNEDAQNG